MMWLYGSGFPKSHNIGKGVNKKLGNDTEWEGWGTALKPAHEPIAVGRKPLSESSNVNNVLKHRTGGINIDECRIEGGRFPANVMHDGSDVIVNQFPNTKPVEN